ncbi:MAG: ABC transporter permease subunit, partial [Acidimicrobiales bacterium]|nr:ABC transporter permease subunit [Acidimicrobiales bacterium]
MELTTLRRGWGWGSAGVLAAALVVAPLLVLPLAFVERTDTWSLLTNLLPGAIGRSLLLAVGVAAGTILLGTAFAILVAFYEFPGRRFVEWAVVLPLGMPAYILTFVILGQYDGSSALKRAASAIGFAELPEVRSPAGAIVMLTLVLYPYVYLVARAAFLEQSASLLEAARTLGMSHGASIRRVALPLARPALAAGASIAVMEALADFGTVNLLGFRTLPDAIYRLWYGAFDRQAALQVGAVLLG